MSICGMGIVSGSDLNETGNATYIYEYYTDEEDYISGKARFCDWMNESINQ